MIRQLILNVIALPVYWLSFFIPKKPNLWVFGAWNGRERGDNSEALFRYVLNNHPEIEVLWLTRNRKVIREFRNNGWPVCYAFGLKAFFYSMRARVGIVNCYKYDLNKYALSRTEMVQLWHGTPFKKIEADSQILMTNQKRNLSRINTSLFPFLKEQYDLIISPSEETSGKLASAFQVSQDKVVVTGYPRNDQLFAEKQTFGFLAWLHSKRQIEHIVLYAPTFRDSNTESLDIFRTLDVKEMQNFLRQKKVLLIIKGHMNVGQAFTQLQDDHSEIFIATKEDIPDVNAFMPHVDILITDYSSIWFDFLLLNRPIIFTPFDIENYLRKDREMYYDYDGITPGPKAKSWHEVIRYLEQFTDGQDDYLAERDKIGQLFNAHQDNNSCERVFNCIIQKIRRS